MTDRPAGPPRNHSDPASGKAGAVTPEVTVEPVDDSTEFQIEVQLEDADAEPGARSTASRAPGPPRGDGADAANRAPHARREPGPESRSSPRASVLEEEVRVVRTASGNRVNVHGSRGEDDEPRPLVPRTHRRVERRGSKPVADSRENRRGPSAAPQDGEIRVVRTASGNRINIHGDRSSEPAVPLRRSKPAETPREAIRVSKTTMVRRVRPGEDTAEAAAPSAGTVGQEPRVVRTATGNRVHLHPDRPADRSSRGRVVMPEPMVERKRRSPVPFLLLAVVLMLGAVGFALRARSEWNDRVEQVQRVAENAENGRAESAPAPSTPTRTSADRADLEFAENGDLVRVRGASPEAVAVAYCRASGECHPGASLELAAPADQRIGVQVAVYTDAEDLFHQIALYIYRDRSNGTWVAGDGNRRIVVFDLDKVQLDSKRIPVDR